MWSSVVLMYFLIKIKHCDKKEQNIFAAGHTVSSAAQWSLSSLHSHCMHVGPTHWTRDSFSVFLHFPLEVQNSEAKVPLRASWRSLFCLATMAQFVAVSHMRLHTGMSPWRSASGFFCRRDPWSNERTHTASVGSLSRDEPGGATQAKSAAGARRVKSGEAESCWRVIDGIFKIKALKTPVRKRQRGKNNGNNQEDGFHISS